jgi:hypothetical protein
MKIYFAGGGVSDKCNDNIKFDSRLLSFYFLSVDKGFKQIYKIIFEELISRKNENISRNMAGRKKSGRSIDQ